MPPVRDIALKRVAPVASPRDLTTTASSAQAERSLLEVVWLRRGTVVACLVAALCVGAVYHHFTPRQYRSTAQLFLQHSSQQDSTPLGGSVLQAATPAAHRLMITSNVVLQAALERMSPQLLAHAGDNPARYLRDRLQVQTAGDDSILTVSLQGDDPQVTAAMVNHVVWAYKERVRITATGQLVTRTQSAASETDRAGDGQSFVALDRQAIAAHLEQLTIQQTTARMRERRLAALRDAAQASDGTVGELAVLLDAAEPDAPPRSWVDTRDLQTRLDGLEAALAMYAGRLGDEHHVVRALHRQAAQTEARIEARQRGAARQMLAHLGQLHEAAAARSADLADMVRRWEQHAAAAQEAALPVAELDPALVDRTPVAPRFSRVMAIAGVGGLLLGVALGLGSDVAGRRRDAVAEVHQQLDDADDVDLHDPAVPLYGSVPVMHGIDAGAPGADATAMSMHQIRALLQLRAAADHSRAFAITSPSRGAGKTSIAVGLASSLGLAGTRTLLVDCDLAGRMQRERNQASGSTHASAQNVGDVLREMGYLTGGGANGHAETMLPQPRRLASQLGLPAMLDGKPLAECVVATSVPGLAVLPAVFVEHRHVAQLSTRFLRDLIEAARADYDMILFDTGPVPGGAEPLLVAGAVDGVVLVAARGETRSRFNRSLAYLRTIEARVIGTVFNRAAADEDEAGFASAGSASDIGRREDNYGSGLLAMAVCGKRDQSSRSTFAANGDLNHAAPRPSPSASGLDADFDQPTAASPEEALVGLEPLSDDDDIAMHAAAQSQPIWVRICDRLKRGGA